MIIDLCPPINFENSLTGFSTYKLETLFPEIILSILSLYNSKISENHFSYSDFISQG